MRFDVFGRAVRRIVIHSVEGEVNIRRVFQQTFDGFVNGPAVVVGHDAPADFTVDDDQSFRRQCRQ